MERYADDEQRSRAKQIRLSPLGCGGMPPSPASLLLGVSLWIRPRRRSLDPTAWRSQRGSREVLKPALKVPVFLYNEPVADYSFVTRWSISSPLEKVWDAVFHSERWPSWWKGVERVVEIEPATGECAVGSLRRYTWKSRLPYRLTFDMRVTRVEPLVKIESAASGELEGTGVWSFSRKGAMTHVRYDWNVRTTKLWMNVAAPIAGPLFKWNHNVVMGWGSEGLANLLSKGVKSAS